MGERKKISSRVRGNTKLILMAADQDPSLSSGVEISTTQLNTAP